MTTDPTPASNPSTAITETPAAAPATSGAASAPAISPVTSVPATPPAPEAAPTWPEKADLAVLVLLLILSFFLASFTATNSDLWSHLAIGKRYSEGKFEFGVDPFSWATEASEGKPAVYWVHHSWLFSWLLYGLYTLTGGAGLVIFKAIVFTASIALLMRIGWNETNRWFVLICVMMAALAVSHRVALQPIVMSVLFLTITLYVLDRVGLFAFKRPEPSHAPPASPALGTVQAATEPAAAAPPVPLPQSAQGDADRSRWLWYLPLLFALWANFDSWFILGPLVLALCWAATGLRKWVPCSDAVSGKMLGQVLGVSLLACIVNPHHVRVFQLPPDLAYMVMALCDPVGIPLPDALVAAGRTLKGLSSDEPGAAWTLSTLDRAYWRSPVRGMHASGYAAGPLFILGLVSFTLVALVKQRPGAPALHGARFLLWLMFAVMAVALYRMIPYFALIAAPLTAMTLGEFLQWQQVSNAVTLAKRDRGLNLARMLTVPLVILLIVLAWPGVLGPRMPGEDWYSAPRRVSWGIRPDPSMRKAAEVIAALHEKNECVNVFNENVEIGNYLPWFAPGVKFYRDMRLSLYANQGTTFTKAREALLDPSKPTRDWELLFEKHQIDQAVMSNLLFEGRIDRWWGQSQRWRQRFADTRVAVFSWAGPDKAWPAGLAWNDSNRQAFGQVADRPPPHGTPAPDILSVWELYRDGVGPRPGLVGEVAAYNRQYLVEYNNQLRPFHFLPLPLATSSFMFFCANGAQVPAAGNGMSFAPTFAILANQFKPADLGWPALPILMIRAGRNAIAENPLDPACHIALVEAYEVQLNQENHWAKENPWTQQFGPVEVRSKLRQFQLAAGFYTAAQLQQDRFEYNFRLAEFYRRQQVFDMALEHMQLALKGREEMLSNMTDDTKKIQMDLKAFHEQFIAPLDRTVGLRRGKLKENTVGAEPVQKALHALLGPYQELNERTGRVEQSRLGLGKEALKLVDEIDFKLLKEQEQSAYLPVYFRLLVEMGRADQMTKTLEKEDIRKVLPPTLLMQYQMLLAGAAGDYTGLDETLAVYEKGIREQTKELRARLEARQMMCAPPMMLVPTHLQPSTFAGAFMQTIYFHDMLNIGRGELARSQNDLFNLMTLRGVNALEAGDTRRAREILDGVLREAGDIDFQERAMALRYRDLLKEQAK